MTINIDADIDENIDKLDELLEKLKLLEDKSKMLNFITIKEFATIRKCSLKIAQTLFNEQSFPSEDYGKTKVAEVSAVIKWYQQKRSKHDSDQTAQKIRRYKNGE